jgi:hypothetical protein
MVAVRNGEKGCGPKCAQFTKLQKNYRGRITVTVVPLPGCDLSLSLPR